MSHLQLGVIGLGTMGANLARNAARNEATVAVFNRTTEKTDAFMKEFSKEGDFVACHSLKDLVKALKPPRQILLMIKAGEAVDQMIEELLPLLSKGDILIDAGNSHYRETDRREAELKKKGMHFIGMGVSGGEEGALRGPSMMPGGDRKAIDELMPLFEKIAADDGMGGKCVAYMGPGGAGHFVKMVHNGVEYALMQLLAECYDVLKREVKLSNAELADLFGAWNRDPEISSFLLEITEKIFRKKDPETGDDLIDLILDSASQKGTGKWTTAAAFDYGVAVPMITAAVEARIMSGTKEFRMQRSLEAPVTIEQPYPEPQKLMARVRTAMELSTISAYAEGFLLLKTASDSEGWDLSIPEVARIWQGGCIIRSAILPKFRAMISGDKKALTELRERTSGDRQLEWRRAVQVALGRGIPVPVMAMALISYDVYRAERLPQNLIQAQRDFFGAHTFERLDKKGMFHADWQ